MAGNNEMNLDFLTAEQKSQYGKFSGEPNELQLARYFHLDEADLEFISNRRGDHNRLGFALQITSIRFLGGFLSDLNVVPISVQRFVAAQLSIEISVLSNYAKRTFTKYDHSVLIREQYGYSDFNELHWKFRLSRLLYARAWIGNERPSLMFDFSTAWLIQNKILLPGVSTLCRLIAEIREKSSKRLWRLLSALPTIEQKEKLKTLLKIREGKRFSNLDYYRKSPTTISSNSFNLAITRYVELRDFGIQSIDFSHIPPVRLKMIARHAGMITAPKIAEMPEQKRIAILVAFVKTFEIATLDDALEVLDQLISEIIGTAKRRVQKNRIRTLKDLDKSALALAEVCALILNDETNNDALRDGIFAKISKEKLIESINTVNSLVSRNGDFYEEMIDQYGRVQRFLPTLLKNITFKAAPAGETTLQALNYLKSIEGDRKQILKNPPVDFVTAAWKKQIYDENNCITKQAYTLCVLQQLQDSLRRRDIYVERSERWSDTREKLLQGAAWQANRIQVSRSLGHSLVASEVIEKLTSQLDKSYKQIAANFSENTAITIDNSGKNTALTITNLDKLEESEALVQFKEQIAALLPKIDLTELILEIHAHTGFANEFNHVSEANSRAADLSISICAVLIAEACNIGLEPLIKSHIPALTQIRLNWVKQNYLRAETIANANAKLVNYQSTLLLAQKWGGGEVASADGMRFVVSIPTINAGANRKYFGSKKGITWYNFISDQFSGFHGIVVPGTLRDSIFVLEGLLEQQTDLNPTEIMTDTAGASDMIFGLFWLLGYQFSPRLVDAGESIFYRIDKSADYGILNELAASNVIIDRIEQHWDDMMRVAGSLKLGTVRASELIRSLLKSDKPSNLAKAIIDAGRINKTLYLLNYINDEDYRRRILTQLNRGEGRHSVARAICYGRRGEIRKLYREGQEDQLAALGLVLNAVVLWNTIYTESALDHLKNKAVKIDEHFEQRLSPLLYEHINVLGHYSFTLSEQIEKGKLRQLNQVEIP
jgi:TnpA family transposase